MFYQFVVLFIIKSLCTSSPLCAQFKQCTQNGCDDVVINWKLPGNSFVQTPNRSLIGELHRPVRLLNAPMAPWYIHRVPTNGWFGSNAERKNWTDRKWSHTNLTICKENNNNLRCRHMNKSILKCGLCTYLVLLLELWSPTTRYSRVVFCRRLQQNSICPMVYLSQVILHWWQSFARIGHRSYSGVSPLDRQSAMWSQGQPDPSLYTQLKWIAYQKQVNRLISFYRKFDPV